MQRTVELDFLEVWELLNAIEQRLDRLGRISQPELAVPAMGRLITAGDKIRRAFSFDAATDARQAAAFDATMADLDDLAAIADGLPDVPLASWAPGEITEMYGR